MTSDYDPARTSLLKLVEHVFNHRDGLIQPIYYNELAHRIGRLNKQGQGHGHGMGGVLGKMGHLLQAIEGEWGEPIPHIQSLVVNMTGTSKGLPDDGIKEFWPDYPNLSKLEKGNRTRIEHQRVVAFGSRWNDVLTSLGLPVVASNGDSRSATQFRGNGGESDSHKRLKEFVRNHPELVGAASDWSAIEEYPLPTFDEIDVLFRTSDACIAVEVKAAVSDGMPSDYERGLYQTIKYGALLEAMSRTTLYKVPSQIETVLVLESRLPEQFCSLAKTLGVRVIESIKPPKAK